MHRVDRVLDVRQGELCWVAGTVYMDMPLKPNILDDISKDVRGLSVVPTDPTCAYLAPSIGALLRRPVKSMSHRLVKIRLCSRMSQGGFAWLESLYKHLCW